ncbi:DUF4177 domain-containing protein [Roseicyclus sp.]|uniref:DUF4177 domain-containing protein n=1 Tax=Roseicyclus sp. TaxID=1914329 RepID=UPI003FA0A946
MPFYEYKVVPAPERAPKVRGLKGCPKFAHALETLMNELAQDGWEYFRAESLPDEEKKGLMGGKEIVTRNVLIFRRELYFEEPGEDAPAPQPEARAPLSLTTPAPAAEAPLAPAGEPPPQFGRRPLVAERKEPGQDH